MENASSKLSFDKFRAILFLLFKSLTGKSLGLVISIIGLEFFNPFARS